MYFLVLYEMFPQFIFEGQTFLFTLILPLAVIIVGLNFKKINLKNLSLKSLSIKNMKSSGGSKNKSSDSLTTSIDSMLSDSGNLDIESLLATSAKSGGNEEGLSEIDKLLAGAEKSGGNEEGLSEIDKLLAGAEKSGGNEEGLSEIDKLLTDSQSESSVSNSISMDDTNLLIMEKMEPLENDIQTIKTDFDQFKQDLTSIKEEVEILSSSFEATLTDIKFLTTDANNPLNFMKEDTFKKNIQKINVDELIIKTSTNTDTEPIQDTPTPKPIQDIQTPKPIQDTPTPKPIVLEAVEKEISDLPEDVIALVDELFHDFDSEQVFELTKIHCKTCKIIVDEFQLISFIDKKNNSNFLKNKFNSLESQPSQILNEVV